MKKTKNRLAYCRLHRKLAKKLSSIDRKAWMEIDWEKGYQPIMKDFIIDYRPPCPLVRYNAIKGIYVSYPISASRI